MGIAPLLLDGRIYNDPGQGVDPGVWVGLVAYLKGSFLYCRMAINPVG